MVKEKCVTHKQDVSISPLTETGTAMDLPNMTTTSKTGTWEFCVFLSDDVCKKSNDLNLLGQQKKERWFHFTARSDSSASSCAPPLPLPVCSLISSPSSRLILPCSLLIHLLFLFLLLFAQATVATTPNVANFMFFREDFEIKGGNELDLPSFW